MRRLIKLAIRTMLSVVILLSALPMNTFAVTASDWRAGNIINDTLFTDGSGMSVSQIHAFLKNKLPYCDIWGTKTSELGHGTRAQYGAYVGNPAPFTCITNYYEVPKTAPGAYIPENNYGRYNTDGSTHIPTGSKSAAQLIYDAAQRYNINPKALLIKLATESKGPLTSDEWPLKKQYYYAMGAHCPDSGAGGSANCDINYSGFSMQIAESAKLLRSYLDGMTQSWWPYKKPYQTNYVLWNVTERGCGGANVFIETKATAALYTYTPYQPNAAALANMYGTGDYCSAYGNRNFWRVWNDWFGSTQDAGYTPFFQLQGSVTTYVFGANKTYYTITDYLRLKDYGFESSFKQRTKTFTQANLAGYTHKGTLPAIARFEGIGVFLLQDGQMRPFPSEATLGHYGYQLGQEATLPKEMADVLPTSTPMWQVAGESDGKTTYYIENGKKQALCNWNVYTKLGSPIYSSQPISPLKSSYLATISTGGPIAMQGDVIESWGTGKYGLWENGSYIPMNSDVAKKSGTISCGAPAAAVSQLPTSTKSIDNLVSDSSGKRFVIDGTKKLAVDSSDTATLGASPEQYIPTTNAFLDKLTSGILKPIVRADGTASVYVLKDGKFYGIPTESDLYGLGYNFNQVQNITGKTLSTFKSSGYIYKPGRLVRESNSLGVYLVDNAFKKYPFGTEADFYNYGATWSSILVVPPGSLSGYEAQRTTTYYIKENDSLYWLMDRGVKYRIPNELIASEAYNITPSNSVTLPIPVLSLYPMKSQPLTRVFRSGSDAAVYLIENGKKRAFTSESAFFSHGFKWSDVTSLNPDYVRSLPSGPNIN